MVPSLAAEVPVVVAKVLMVLMDPLVAGKETAEAPVSSHSHVPDKQYV